MTRNKPVHVQYKCSILPKYFQPAAGWTQACGSHGQRPECPEWFTSVGKLRQVLCSSGCRQLEKPTLHVTVPGFKSRLCTQFQLPANVQEGGTGGSSTWVPTNMWETQTDLAPSFGMAQPWLLQAPGEWTSRGEVSHLCFSLSFPLSLFLPFK